MALNVVEDLPKVAGTVEGDGRRVVALTGGAGGYAELAAVPAESVFDIPDGVSDAARRRDPRAGAPSAPSCAPRSAAERRR